jgi:hypothetical protein
VTLRIFIEHELPPISVMSMNAQMNVSTIREGGFHKGRFSGGCGRYCRWNGGAYYNDIFTCGEFYEATGLSFFCSTDCRDNLPDERSAFLSYRHKDKELCDYVTKSLIANGIEVIRDVRELDRLARISEFIGKADNSRYFIPLITEDYLRSLYCLTELREIAAADSPVRTVPIISETISATGIEAQAIDHWEAILRLLEGVLSHSSSGLFDYLRVEVERVETFSALIADFLADIRTKKVPADLTKASCVYLVAILKRGSRPNEHSGSMHRSRTEIEAIGVKDSMLPEHALFVLDDYDMGRVSESRATGDVMYPNGGLLDYCGHIGIVLSNRALSDPSFVEGLLRLEAQARNRLLPVFVDPILREPFSEIRALLSLEKRLTRRGGETIAVEFGRIGPVVTALRDTLI